MYEKKTVWWINKFVLENNRLTFVDLSSFSISVWFVPIDNSAQVMQLILDEFYFQRLFHYAAFWIVDKRCAIWLRFDFVEYDLILLEIIRHFDYLKYW
jgi:hypothetical protein